MWNLTVSNLLVAENLLAEQSSVQYSGEAVQSKIQETLDEGNVFVLVTLTIEKQQAGAAAFTWERCAAGTAAAGTCAAAGRPGAAARRTVPVRSSMAPTAAAGRTR